MEDDYFLYTSLNTKNNLIAFSVKSKSGYFYERKPLTHCNKNVNNGSTKILTHEIKWAIKIGKIKWRQKNI